MAVEKIMDGSEFTSLVLRLFDDSDIFIILEDVDEKNVFSTINIMNGEKWREFLRAKVEKKKPFEHEHEFGVSINNTYMERGFVS